MQSPEVVVTHATTFDNPHLPDPRKQRLADRYEGTSIGRQELLGEIVQAEAELERLRTVTNPEPATGRAEPKEPVEIRREAPASITDTRRRETRWDRLRQWRPGGRKA